MITYKECSEEIKNCRKDCKENYALCLHCTMLSAKIKKHADKRKRYIKELIKTKMDKIPYEIINDDCRYILKTLQTCFRRHNKNDKNIGKTKGGLMKLSKGSQIENVMNVAIMTVLYIPFAMAAAGWNNLIHLLNKKKKKHIQNKRRNHEITNNIKSSYRYEIIGK